MFATDLVAIDKLRNDAINVQEAHVSGVTKISVYAAQLLFISGKFPIDVCTGIHFTPRFGVGSPLVGLTGGRRSGQISHGIQH